MMTEQVYRQRSDTMQLLLEKCRQRDAAAQRELYQLCYESFIKTCHRYAGDMDGAGIIINNALLRIFKNLDSYSHQGKFLGWVQVIVLNCCLDYVKKNHRMRFEPLTLEQEEEISIPSNVLEHAGVEQLHRAIASLPKTTSVVFNLFIYEGYSHKDIAQLLHISEGTSKWHVNEGRKKIKEKLQFIYNKKK
jgi:RNA polymerase sigma-70 factor, ECF subfamily